MLRSSLTYCSFVYVLFALTNVLYLLSIDTWSVTAAILMCLAVLFYSFLTTVPAIAGSVLCHFLKAKKIRSFVRSWYLSTAH